MVATSMSQGMAFLSFAIAARVLTKVEFGELAMIQSTVSMFGVFAGMGLGLTATKHVAEYRDSEPERADQIISLTLLTGIVTGGIVTLIFAICSPWLADDTLNAPHLAAELRIGSALLFLNTIDGVQLGALMGFEAFPLIARTSFFRGMANLVLVVSGVFYWGLRGALCGLVGAAAVGLLINHLALRSQSHAVPVTYQDLRRELPILWKYSVPAFLSGAVVAPAGWLARTFLVNQPGGYAAMAVFGIASRFQDVIGLAGSTIGAALLPMLASDTGSKSEGLRRGNVLLSWVTGTALVLPLLCFPEAAGAFFGSQYVATDARRTLVLMLLCTAVIMYKQGLARVLAANNLMWWGALSNFTWAFALVAIARPLARGGATGLAAAVLISYGINTLIFMPLYLRKGLAPSALLASFRALAIWMALLGLALISYIGASLGVRCFVGAAALAVVFVSFKQLALSKVEELPQHRQL
jgi:O-antigen/teichoic acid export membrane protein